MLLIIGYSSVCLFSLIWVYLIKSQFSFLFLPYFRRGLFCVTWSQLSNQYWADETPTIMHPLQLWVEVNTLASPEVYNALTFLHVLRFSLCYHGIHFLLYMQEVYIQLLIFMYFAILSIFCLSFRSAFLCKPFLLSMWMELSMWKL